MKADELTLPVGWAAATVGDIAEYINGKAFKASDWAQSGRPIIRIQNLSGTSSTFNFTEAQVEGRYVVPPGTILVSWSATLDAFIWEGPEAVLNQHIFKVLPNPAVACTGFAYWSLRHAISEMRKSASLHGSTMKHINRGPFLAHALSLPPLNEQRRIVSKIEALQARSRRAREALEAVPSLLEKFRQSVLAAAFRGDLTADWRAKNPDVEPASVLLERIRTERRRLWEEAELAKMEAKGKPPKNDKWKAKYKEPEPVDPTGLPELPEGWCWATTAELVEPSTIITYGVVKPGPHVEGGTQYVRGQDVQDGTILADQLLRMSPDLAATKPNSVLVEGDIVLCIIRHLRVGVVPPGMDGANLTQGAVRMRPSFALRGGYIANWLASPLAQSLMTAKHFGIAMPRINVEDARRVPVPLSPVAEQQEIEARIQRIVVPLTDVQRLMAEHESQIAALDESILAKAFRGELVPQDSNDEPASVLLDRIRAERAKKEKPKRKPRQKKGKAS